MELNTEENAEYHNTEDISKPIEVANFDYVKHLVLSGGGPSIFCLFGALKHLHDVKHWNINNIESIYCCSSGAFLGVCLCLVKLGLTFDELENYLINRSWDKLFKEEVLDFKTAFESKGLFDCYSLRKAISPLLTATGLSDETTLKELFDKTNIKLTAFSTNISVVPFQKVSLSYQTFADISLYKILIMTMGVPGILTPTFIDNMCLIDGGLLVNYPYLDCYEDMKPESDNEVLGFKIKWENRDLSISETSNLFSFIGNLTKNMSIHIGNTTNIIPEKFNTIQCKTPYSGGVGDWVDIMGNSEMRKLYLEAG